jgi:group I intron endonuclease
MSGFVYLWENKTNGKMYVGSHKGRVDDNYIGSGVYFKRAYELNPDNFVRYILYKGKDYLTVEDVILKFFDAANNESFYNLKNDAVGGWDHCQTKEVRSRIAKAISLAKKGKTYDFMFYDKNGENNPMYGRKHSYSSRKKMSEKRKGLATHKKSVIEKTTNTKFETVTECAKYFNVSQPTMTALIRNQKINRGACKGKIFSHA